MKALQSKLARQMLDAGIDITKHVLTGKPFTFNGVTYIAKKVPAAKSRK